MTVAKLAIKAKDAIIDLFTLPDPDAPSLTDELIRVVSFDGKDLDGIGYIDQSIKNEIEAFRHYEKVGKMLEKDKIITDITLVKILVQA